MGWFSKKDDRPPEERQADLIRHKTLRLAAEQAAKNIRDQHVVHDELNEAVVDAERDVPWWRR